MRRGQQMRLPALQQVALDLFDGFFWRGSDVGVISRWFIYIYLYIYNIMVTQSGFNGDRMRLVSVCLKMGD